MNGLQSPTSREHYQHLCDLVSFCHQAGMEFVVLTPPVREVYDRTIRSDPQLRTGLCRYESTLASLNVPYLLCHRPIDRQRLQLRDSSDFLDYTHLNANGSAKLTRFVAEELLRREWVSNCGRPMLAANNR